jgi:hypothetical protein
LDKIAVIHVRRVMPGTFTQLRKNGFQSTGGGVLPCMQLSSDHGWPWAFWLFQAWPLEPTTHPNPSKSSSALPLTVQPARTHRWAHRFFISQHRRGHAFCEGRQTESFGGHF